MAKLSLAKGTTSYLSRIFIQDSSSTTGAGLTGLTNASSGLVCYRARDDDGNAAGTAISLSAGTRGTWSSGGFVEKDATNMPGVYEFGVPNAAIATGSKSVLIMFKGATNMAPLPLEIELTGWDNQDAVRGGMTALPNAVPGAAGGVFIAGTNAPVTITGSGDALTITSSGGNGAGIIVAANGTGHGIKSTGGATSGDGLRAIGGGSGNGLAAVAGATGVGLIATGGATSGDGAQFTAATSGSGLRATAAGAAANGLIGTGAGTGSGIAGTGSTSGAGILGVGGATGAGLQGAGGATSGDGIRASAQALGHGLNLIATGSSSHGLFATGGTAGTSDGIKAAAGTGGVDIRGAITGNVTGNLSGSVGSVTGAVGSVTGAVASVTGNVGGNVVGTVASVVGAVASVTGNVGGNVVGSVGSVTGAVGSVTAAVAITSNVKKNQALAKFEFLMTDSTTHAPVTGKTVSVTRSIDNGAFGAGTLSAVTEIASGIYSVDFASGDLNGNVITLRATASGCDDALERIVTQP